MGCRLRRKGRGKCQGERSKGKCPKGKERRKGKRIGKENKYGSGEFDQISNKICDNSRKIFVVEGRQWLVQKVEVGQNGREEVGEHGGNPGREVWQIIHNIDEVIDDGGESKLNVVGVDEFLLVELLDELGGEFGVFVFLREEGKDVFHQQASFLIAWFWRKNVKFSQINSPSCVGLFHENE